MVNYRRSQIAGGTYFFTVTLRNRKSKILINKLHLLQMAVQEVKCQKPFKMNAYVILPDHLHMIWTLPKNDSNYSDRWKKIKALFSKSLIKSGVNLSKSKHNEYHLWTRRFWEHTVRHDADYENYVNYIHYNPIKHGLVDDLKNWPYSSFHHFVSAGLIDENWGSSVIQLVDGDCFGE